MRWRVKNPQHSAQHGRKNKPETCCGNDGTQALRDEYVRNEQIAVHLTLLSRRNGEQLATDTAAVNADESSRESPAVESRTGEAPGGYGYTCTLFKDDNERIVVEYWLVHGAAHAWFGGDTRGSFMDPNGPDASSEMMRIFLERTRA